MREGKKLEDYTDEDRPKKWRIKPNTEDEQRDIDEYI